MLRPLCLLQELFRKVRSILNKLTPQKFNQLMKQVTDLTIDTEERLKGVIDLVFEKAIDEPNFSVAYGNMCRCLATVSSSTKQAVATETGRRSRSFRLKVTPEQRSRQVKMRSGGRKSFRWHGDLWGGQEQTCHLEGQLLISLWFSLGELVCSV